MAFSFIIRRASSPVFPLAIRAVGSPRTFHKAIGNILNNSELNKDSKDNIQVVKQLVDDNLLRVIDADIKRNHVQCKIPKKFPFDVKDNYSENGTIILKREYFNELIKVEVNLAAPNETGEYESDSDSSKSDDDKDKGSDSESNTGSDTDAKSDESSNDRDDGDGDGDGDDRVRIPLTVNVSKGGSNISLKLYVNAFPDEISIESVAVMQSIKGYDDASYICVPPQFWRGVDDTVKDALHRYLEVRGIDVSMANVLHKNCEHKMKYDQTKWLKKLKKFIKK